ncbi:MAG: hypothetical protein ABJ310_06460 [Roseobacter sp.]
MKKSVQGVTAPTPRMTKTAALGIAIILSTPVFILLSLIDWFWL